MVLSFVFTCESKCICSLVYFRFMLYAELQIIGFVYRIGLSIHFGFVIVIVQFQSMSDINCC
jgi:hypothetical protein